MILISNFWVRRVYKNKNIYEVVELSQVLEA